MTGTQATYDAENQARATLVWRYSVRTIIKLAFSVNKKEPPSNQLTCFGHQELFAC